MHISNSFVAFEDIGKKYPQKSCCCFSIADGTTTLCTAYCNLSELDQIQNWLSRVDNSVSTLVQFCAYPSKDLTKNYDSYFRGRLELHLIDW